MNEKESFKVFRIYVDEIKSFPYSMEKTFSLANMNLPEEIFVKISVDVTAGKDYILRGEMKTDFSLECVKCLDEVVEKIDTSFTVLFTNKNISKQLSHEELDSDMYEITDGYIDFLPVIIDALNSCLPMKIMCDDDCKGLCLLCGVNLNNETCNCHEKLEELKTINDKPKNNAFAELKSLMNFDEVD